LPVYWLLFFCLLFSFSSLRPFGLTTKKILSLKVVYTITSAFVKSKNNLFQKCSFTSVATHTPARLRYASQTECLQGIRFGFGAFFLLSTFLFSCFRLLPTPAGGNGNAPAGRTALPDDPRKPYGDA